GRQPESLEELGDEFDSDLGQLVLSCLKANPQERPESAAVLGEALAALAGESAGGSPHGRAPSSSTRSGKALAAFMVTRMVGAVELQ
ncbi:MAG: hypothetical protein GWO24_02730, partial [Akkermansiaceae bacterium]|nr:hypothetical protein [Akkermansiaceae bacterium]